jgi:glycosyltransferase involved in cell wall biosynthesis
VPRRATVTGVHNAVASSLGLRRQGDRHDIEGDGIRDIRPRRKARWVEVTTLPQKAPSIAVIMPAFNEASRIEQTIATIARYRAANPSSIRAVFVADDGSSDDTISVAMRAAQREGTSIEIVSLPHRGKALTVRSAMLEVAERSDADYLMMLDADDELRIDQLDNVRWSSDRHAVYIGRRDHEAKGAARPTTIRRLMSLLMRTASHVLLGLPYRDTQCGFKLFPREIAHDLFSQQRSSGWTFDAEVLFIAYRVSHLPIVEVPVIWSPRGVSRVRPLAAAISGLALFGTAWNRVRGAYRPVAFRPIDQPRTATIES